MSACAPEISVVVGVRDGGAETLPSLDGVLTQEGVELELVVVDDGSIDETPEVLVGLARRDSRVRVIRQEAEGLTAALVRGCAAARGELIARQDIGDASLPGRLAKQRDALRRWPEVVLVSCWSECVGPAGELIVLQRSPDSTEGPRPILSSSTPLTVAAGPTSHGSAMFRRSAYEAAGGYRLEFGLGQDWDLWQRLGLSGSYCEIPELLYRRMLSPRSISFAFHDAQIEIGRLSLAATRARSAGGDETPVLHRARILSHRMNAERDRRRRAGIALGNYHLGEALRRRRDSRARAYLSAAIRARPIFPRAWVRWLQASVLLSGSTQTKSPGAVTDRAPTR
ncbi:MAG: glycosyltransferase [Thermoanaerobaculia bacterium]